MFFRGLRKFANSFNFRKGINRSVCVCEIAKFGRKSLQLLDGIALCIPCVINIYQQKQGRFYKSVLSLKTTKKENLTRGGPP